MSSLGLSTDVGRVWRENSMTNHQLHGDNSVATSIGGTLLRTVEGGRGDGGEGFFQTTVYESSLWTQAFV
jgi:hypothetical protein